MSKSWPSDVDYSEPNIKGQLLIENGRLKKRIEELETLLNEYKGAECRALKSQGEALVMIEQLQAQVDAVHGLLKEPDLKQFVTDVNGILKGAVSVNGAVSVKGAVSVSKLRQALEAKGEE